jgi:hypothetical protein
MGDIGIAISMDMFKNLDKVICEIAYAQGHSSGESEVDAITKELRTEIYTALSKDLNKNTPHGGY